MRASQCRSDKTLVLLISRLTNWFLPLQVALATLLLNFSVDAVTSGSREAQDHCITALCTSGGEMTDGEARYRALVAIGTLLTGLPSNAVVARDFGLAPTVSSWRDGARQMGGPEAEKVADCAGFVASSL